MRELRDRLQAALGDAYRIERELGGGGMSRVFVAEQTELGRKVVVKVLPPEMAAGVNADRFRREIQLAARLQHPHIVPLLHAGRTDDLIYYTMPLVEGESLRAKLGRERELPIPKALRILRDVTDALAYAHQHGVVHRDIKPDNVLVAGHHAVVTDFGVAKAISAATGETALTSLGMALGTPAYMAPEQAAGDPHLDHRADIYALGVLAYEMLTGRPPFAGMGPQQLLAAQVTQAPEPVTRHRAAVPPALAALVMRCLEKKAADRWQHAAEMHQQLEAMATPTDGVTPTGAAPYDGVHAAAAERAHPLRVAGLFLAASAGVLGLVYFARELLGLPDWVLSGAVVLLTVGLPVVVTTGLVERRRAIARSIRPQGAPSGGWHGLFTWRKALLGGVASFATLGLGAAAYMAMRVLGIGPVGTLVASGVLEERARLVLAEFENRTPDSTLGRSVGEALRVDLAQSPLVRLLDASAVNDALRRMGREPGAPLDVALAQELAQREGAAAVVRGQVTPAGRGYVLTAELVGARDGAVLVAQRETAKDDGAIIEAIDRLSKRLRERIGESLRTIRASEPLERVTTASLEALRKYSQAIAANDAGEWDRAVALLEEATALDTAFAMAHRKLAVVLSNTGAARSRIAAAATKAFDHRDRLPAIERYLSMAYYYSSVEFDRDRTAAAYRSVLEVAPDNYVALNNLALLYNQTRRFAAAESLTIRGLAVNPSPPLYRNAVMAQVAQGKLREAERTVDLFERRAPGNPQVTGMRAALAVVRGAYDTAEAYVRSLERSQPDLFWQAVVAFELYAYNALHGRLAAAEREMRRYVDISERRGLPDAYLTGALSVAMLDLRLRASPATARRTVEAALRRRPLEALAPADRPYVALAWFFAATGEPARARRYMAEYEAAIPEAARRANEFRHGADAEIAFAEGRLPEAINGYRRWHEQGGCTTCGLFYLGLVYERAGERDSARVVFERTVSTPDIGRLYHDCTTLALTYKRLGELYQERGERDKARDYYGRFVDLWAQADAELQPMVRDVRERLARLST